ncbi:hypothetical protein Tco_0430313, partial [Tanacetum coccineum]
MVKNHILEDILELPVLPDDELDLFIHLNGMSINGRPMKEGALVHAGISQHWELDMARVFYRGNE